MRYALNRRLLFQATALIAAGILFVPGLLLKARQKAKAHTSHTRRRSHSRHHYTSVRLQPERVKEIQQALAKAGVLHQDPNGIWDDATREAMRQYQKESGFAPTGLPEAKPLMKLGLGPHPLPPGLAPLATASAAGGGDADASAGPDSSETLQPATSNP